MKSTPYCLFCKQGHYPADCQIVTMPCDMQNPATAVLNCRTGWDEISCEFTKWQCYDDAQNCFGKDTTKFNKKEMSKVFQS